MNQLQAADAVVRGLLIGLYMAISVGPTLFAVIKYSMENSHKAALSFVAGVSLSDILYVAIANLAANWLTVLDSYSRYIGYTGSALLIGVGIFGVFKKYKSPEVGTTIPTIKGSQFLRIFLSGFFINSINPGVIISWLTAVSTCADKTAGYRFILFAVCLSLILGIDLLKVFLAGRLRTLLTPKRLVNVQRASSFIILLLGILLFFRTLFFFGFSH